MDVRSQDSRDDNVRELVQRCRAGDEQAATILFRRYMDRLLGLVRERISPRLVSRMDPEDVLQSAYRSFFNGLQHDAFRVDRAEELWGLLSAITMHKLCRKVAYHKAQKRAVDREHRGDDANSVLAAYPELVCELPTPAEAIEFVEELEGVMTRLSEQERTILTLRLEGYTSQEIADRLHRSERTVRRAMERVRAAFQRRLNADE